MAGGQQEPAGSHAQTAGVSFEEFLAWLPADLRGAAGIDWHRVPAAVRRFCVHAVGAGPDAGHLALAAYAAAGAISADSSCNCSGACTAS